MIYLVLIALSVFGVWYSNKIKAEKEAERKRFRDRGVKIYKDSNGVQRSTATGEEVTPVYNNPKYNYHVVLVGKNSRVMFEDLTAKRAEEENAKLRAEGMKYIWKEVLNIDKMPMWVQYDPQNDCYLKTSYSRKSETLGPAYYVIRGQYVRGSFRQTSIERIEDLEEGKKWYSITETKKF